MKFSNKIVFGAFALAAGSQTFSYAAQPGFAVGAKVRVENGTLAAA